MQRKKLLAIGIALALQTSYYPAMAADNTDDDNKCPTNISSLSQAEREKLPAECLITKVEQDNHWGWAAGGIAALAASVALGVHNSDSDGNSHHTVSPTPSDDGGDVTPTPPDDTSIISYSNGVTDDRGEDTLSFNDIKLDNGKHLGPATLSYSKQDERWQLTTLSGKTLDVSGWNVTDDNAAVIEGTQENGLYWKYDSRGYLILADDQTQVTTGDNETHATDRGMTVSGANKTGVIISGDKTTNTLTGDAIVSDGAVGLVITGDNTINTISGDTSVDGAIGALISGSNSSTTLSGNINVSGGGTGMVIDGNRTIIDNTGTSTISSEGSTGSIILGDNTRLINDGELEVSDGATGAKIVGDGAIVDNTGNSTTRGAGSTGLYIEGDDAYVVNAGDQTITDGATGTHIKGDNARMMNAGNVHVDGAGSTVAVIDGNNAKLTQNGDLLVTNGAMGIITNGQGVTLTNNGNITVHDEGSTGFVVAGEQNTLTNKGNIDASLNGTGALVSGTESDVNLSGDINVDSVQDSDGVFQGATGVNVSGSDNAVNIQGNVNVSANYAQDSLISDEIPLNGIAITGNNNDVTLDGTLNLNASDLSNVVGQTQDITGLDIQGDNNNVNITGGLNITATGSTDDENSAIHAININGNSKVTLSGHSTADLTTMIGGDVMLAKVQNGGQLVLDENSSVDIDMNFLDSWYYDYNALLVASGADSDIENQGTINDDGAAQLLMARDGAHVANSGAITAWTKDNLNNSDTRAGIIIAMDKGSVSENKAGGNITLLSDQKPFYSGGGMPEYSLKWYGNTYYAMLANNYGEVSNDAGATITLQGAGVYGVSAAKGTASNAGDIYLDGFVPTLDDAGNITGKTFWQPANLNITSAGMVAGSTDSGNGDATATNTGTITVNNAGFGMMALNGGTAINQGTITLTADEGVTQTDENQLVGMAALNGGTVINDTTGTINIDASFGKPFLADSSSLVVNYGTICIEDSCQDSATYNPTDPYVQNALRDGVIADTDETVTLDQKTIIIGNVDNNGTVNGSELAIQTNGVLTNNASGIINNTITISSGELDNKGIVNSVTITSGTFNNEGTADAQVVMNNGTFNNLASGDVNRGAKLNNNAVVNNSGTWHLGYEDEGADKGTLDLNQSSVFNNSGELIIDNSKNAINMRGASTLYNTGHMEFTASAYNGAINVWGGSGDFINAGTMDATTQAVFASGDNASGDYNSYFWNQESGVINYDLDGGAVVKISHSNFVAQNDGTINVSGNNAYGMYGSKNAQLVNNGTINLGTKGTTDTGMIAMALDSGATADAVIENNGTINIYASDSYAFSVAGAGHVVNNGTVVIDDSVTGSGLIKQGDSVNVEGLNGNNGNNTEVHYADYNLPADPADTVNTANGTSDTASNDLNGYVVGTSADGSAGKLMVSNASLDGVEINTGFTAGTADTTITFDNVVEGSNLSDAGAIQSTTVVWNAQGSTDSSGNVDVTMTKNAYADVATDSSVSDVAQALDAGYTNNELYTSLNVGTTAELNNALKQISGSQATTVFREARILSNRFTMLADAAPQIKDGLAFNVVAKGDPRAELGNDTQYDMLALRQTLDLTASQNLTLEYGIARLDGGGSQKAGDNGLTGGYSQFFGLKHNMAFGEGLAWNNSLRYDVHNLDSSRSVDYSDVNKVADSDARQQYMEFRSEGAKTFSLMDDALKVTPYAGVKFRHTMEDGYKERSAGDFNLSMNSGNETAVDSLVGLNLDYTGKDGWSATATLEGGPNLSYNKSQRTASLQGAAGQSFSVDDGQKGGGVNGQATIGVKYSSNDTALHLDAYQWKEDSISDKGFMLNVKKTFR
ncbi:autotransporter adhesin BigA [Salmonella enterica subsp. diarizonae]|nr:autotransporter domain-containing protein [Salmonella enterica]EBV2371784.1 autotransporter adhesin BigA [Salmonella enterica subsp. enterica serovar Enteritidis]ECC9188267.1 autotransporter adhesin BigA [Salmonella enterica subsp. diarizonae]EGL0765280.1 autotransporter adhesin BigA [Salmonella enterica subsp. enterica]EBE1332285.1 autotransporter domain-containing protein [Salmonella enterica]